MYDYFLKYFSKRSRVLPLSHVIENNESYLHLTGLAGPSGCVCEPQDETLAQDGSFLGYSQAVKLYLSVACKMSL